MLRRRAGIAARPSKVSPKHSSTSASCTTKAGGGLPQDYAEAVRWYRRAAEQGYASAQFNLGLMYGNGQGVLQDYVQAHKWYNLAASRLSSGENRDLAVKNRDIVAPK